MSGWVRDVTREFSKAPKKWHVRKYKEESDYKIGKQEKGNTPHTWQKINKTNLHVFDQDRKDTLNLSQG